MNKTVFMLNKAGKLWTIESNMKKMISGDVFHETQETLKETLK